MADPICPACKAANESDSVYCDQCGQPLAPRDAGAGDGAPDGGGCPACGGEVEELPDGGGRCRACGLELVETPAGEDGEAHQSVTQALTAAILAKVRLGLPIEQSVADACRQVLRAAGIDDAAPAPAASAPATLGRACPVCGADCPAGAERCPECSVWFSARHDPGPCPRCGESASGGRCGCGALLTVPAIAEALEPSVRFLCVKCKQPYVVNPGKCPDCGGAAITVDRLRASL